MEEAIAPSVRRDTSASSHRKFDSHYPRALSLTLSALTLSALASAAIAPRTFAFGALAHASTFVAITMASHEQSQAAFSFEALHVLSWRALL
jgi:hypothetical protein